MTTPPDGGRLLIAKVARRLLTAPRTLITRLRPFFSTPGSPLSHALNVWRTARRPPTPYTAPPPEELATQRAYTFAYTPTISILMPTYNTPEPFLRAAVASVLAQTYPHWQLCIADDASTAPHMPPLLRQLAQSDPRIHLTRRPENGHIAAATNTALSMAHGEYVALLDHDDLLAPNALYEVVRLLQAHPTADLIYTDEDKIDAAGRHTEPTRKPLWSPLLLLNLNAVTHLAVMRRTLVQQVGGFRHAYIGSQDHDLALRLTEHTDAVHHIPQVLYHWRKSPASTASGDTAKAYAYDASLRAVQAALQRRDLPATAQPGRYPPFIRVTWQPSASATLAVIPLTPPPPAWAAACGITPAELLPPPSPALADLNAAAHTATADYLLFIHPALTPESPAWRADMLGHTRVPHTAAVTAKIIRTDGTLIAPALPYGPLHDVPHAHFTINLYKDASRHLTTAPAHLLLVSRRAFLEAGGFDTASTLPLAGPDLCQRLPGGTVFTPHTRWLAPPTFA